MFYTWDDTKLVNLFEWPNTIITPNTSDTIITNVIHYLLYPPPELKGGRRHRRRKSRRGPGPRRRKTRKTRK